MAYLCRRRHMRARFSQSLILIFLAITGVFLWTGCDRDTPASTASTADAESPQDLAHKKAFIALLERMPEYTPQQLVSMFKEVPRDSLGKYAPQLDVILDYHIEGDILSNFFPLSHLDTLDSSNADAAFRGEARFARLLAADSRRFAENIQNNKKAADQAVAKLQQTPEVQTVYNRAYSVWVTEHAQVFEDAYLKTATFLDTVADLMDYVDYMEQMRRTRRSDGSSIRPVNEIQSGFNLRVRAARERMLDALNTLKRLIVFTSKRASSDVELSDRMALLEQAKTTEEIQESMKSLLMYMDENATPRGEENKPKTDEERIQANAELQQQYRRWKAGESLSGA